MSSKIIPPPNGITDTWLKRLRPTGKREEFSDPATSGLRIRMAAKQQAITFIWRAKIDDKITTHTIGHYPSLSLADARRKLLEMKSDHREGNLKTAVDKLRETLNLGQAMDEWYRTIEKRRKRPEKVRQVIDAEIFGKRTGFTGKSLSHKSLKEITKSDVVNLVNSIIARGAVEHSMTVLATLKQFFGWAEDTMDIADPIHRLQRKTFGINSARKSEEHILDIINGEPVKDLPEIRQLFQLIEDSPKMSTEIRTALKVLLLTGVRVGELLLVERHHIMDQGWFIPAKNTKTGVEWIVPISPHTRSLFERLGDDMFGGIDHRAVNRALQRLRERHELPKFTVHTLRKTFRTHIAGFTDFETAEQCLNHSLGHIAARYNKSSSLQKRREVLFKWSKILLEGEIPISYLRAM